MLCSLSITTMDIPLFAVSTTQEWSSLSSLIALCFFSVRLGWEQFLLSKKLDSALSSSASLGSGLVHASSAATI